MTAPYPALSGEAVLHIEDQRRRLVSQFISNGHARLLRGRHWLRAKTRSSLKDAGVGCSVHWRPLHLHPHYRDHFGWEASALPQAVCRAGGSESMPASLEARLMEKKALL